MANSSYLNIPMGNSFYSGIIEKKKVRKEKARWYHEKRTDDQEYLDNILSSYYDMLKLSAERNCSCENASFIAKTKINENGEKIIYYGCSKCGGNFYKFFDFSFLALFLGMKRSGKTTSVLWITEQLHKLDSQRKVALWNCPDNLIFELHDINWCNYYDTVCERAIGIMNWNKYTAPLKKNVPIGTEMIEEPDGRIRINGKPWVRSYPFYQYKNMFYKICPKNKTQTCEECKSCPHFKKGLNYFRKITKADEIEQNDILIMDEAIINAFAKKALSKDTRFWDELIAILGHKRIVMFAMFQRYGIIKSLREMADMMCYKRLPSRLIENEKEDKFMKRHQQKICKLNKDESVIVSELHFYDKVGILYNRVPEWYTDKISTSYTSEIDFVDDRNKMKSDMALGREIADWMREQGIIITDTKDWKDRFLYFKFRIREQFADKMNNRDVIFKYVMEAYFNQQRPPQNDNNEQQQPQEQERERVPIDLSDGTISETELSVFREVCNGRSFTDFDRDPFYLSKARISEIVRNVGNYLLLKCIKNENKNMGDDVERYVKRMAWDEGGIGFRMAGSGGQRGNVPSPDNLIITKNGKIRPVQVKMRSKDVITLSPLTFNNELLVSERLKFIAKKTTIICPHCLETIKGSQTRNGYGFLIPDDAYLYATKRLNRYKIDNDMLIEPILPEDNKKSLRINFENKKVIKQEPDIEKITNKKIIDFLQSDEILYHNENNNGLIEEAIEEEKIEEAEELKELQVNKLDLPEQDIDEITKDDFDGSEFDIDNYDDGEDLTFEEDENFENNSPPY